MKRFWMRRVAGIILIAAVAITVVSAITMLLWNALLPSLFHFPVITWPQALGLLVLSKLLFGGFRGGGPKQQWKNKMKQRWMNMQPEEREKFMQEWGRRCGGRGPWKQATPFGPEGPFSTEKDAPTENAS
jgi:hypothetical protein